MHAPHAQLDKLLIQTTPAYASLKLPVINSHTEQPEMPPHAEDVWDATGHHKFQTHVETDVSLDQDQAALVLKDMVTKDMHALNAQLVKLELLPVMSLIMLTMPLVILVDMVKPVLTHQLAQQTTKLDSPLMHKTVVDAKLANTQDSSLINSELNVLPDHLLTAKTAQPDNQMMDTAVNNAQLDQFKTQIMSRDATDQPVLDNTKSDFQWATSNAVDVRLANGHNTCQTPQELNASLDHLLSAHHAQLDDQMMDTHVLPAQLDKSQLTTM